MRALLAVVVLAQIAACMRNATFECGDRICPPSTLCHEASGTCVLPTQLTACAGAADGTACAFRDRTGAESSGGCVDGSCFATLCGDGRVDAAEDCEPTVAVTATCSSFGFYDDAPIACGLSCRFDLADCTGFCGDGVLNGPEDCENQSVGAATCEQFGYYEAAGLACTRCAYDTTACSDYCGDGIVNGPEHCDSDVIDVAVCVDAGYDRGHATCDAECAVNPTCASIGFVAESVPTGSGAIAALWANAADDVWAVGGATNAATLLHYDGTSWTASVSPVARRLNDVWALREDFVMAVGDDNTVLQFGGALWSERSIGFSQFGTHFVKVHGTSETNVWIVTSRGDVLRDADGDETWTVVPSPLPLPWFNDVWTASPTFTVAAAYGGVYMHNGSGAWTPTTIDWYATSVWGRSATDVYAGTSRGIYHFNGLAWAPVTAFAVGEWTVLGGDTDTAVFSSGLLVRSEPGHTTYFEDFNATSIAVAPNTLLAVSAAAIHRYTGSTWTAPPPAGGLFAIHGVGSDAIAVGPRGRVLHYDGNQWSTREANTVLDFASVWMFDADNAIAVAERNVYRYQGGAWTQEHIAAATLTDVWGTGPDDAYVVGWSATVLRNTGSGWQQVTGVPDNHFHGIWGSANDDIYVLGQRLYRFSETTWQLIPDVSLTVNSEVWGRAADDVYVSTGLGVFHLGANGWSSSPTPTTWHPLATFARSATDVVTVGQYLLTGTEGFAGHYAQGLWSLVGRGMPKLESVWMADNGDTFAVARDATRPLWGRTPGGSFVPVRAHTITTLRATFGVDSRRVFAVGDRGTIVSAAEDRAWVTEDSGVTVALRGVWADITDAVVVGDAGSVRRRSGSTWTPVASGTAAALADVHGSSALDLTIVGSAGTILRYNGATITAQTSGTSVDLHGVFARNGEVIAVGASGTILRNTGSGWMAMASPTQATLRDVWIGANGVRVVVGDGGTILRDDGSGFVEWPRSIDTDVHEVFGSSPDDLFAVAGDGSILHYDGQGWGLVRSTARGPLYGVWTDASSTHFVGATGAVLSLERETTW